MKLYKFNELDTVAAVNEEEARKFYLEKTKLSEEDAFDEVEFCEVDPDVARVVVSDEHEETQTYTYRKAFEDGYFELPCIFTSER